MRPAIAALVLALVAACDGPPIEHRLGAPCECSAGGDCDVAACGDGMTCSGTCVAACAVDADCPEGAACGVLTPGACEYPCETAADCPAWLDRCAGTCYGGALVE